MKYMIIISYNKKKKVGIMGTVGLATYILLLARYCYLFYIGLL